MAMYKRELTWLGTTEGLLLRRPVEMEVGDLLGVPGSIAGIRSQQTPLPAPGLGVDSQKQHFSLMNGFMGNGRREGYERLLSQMMQLLSQWRNMMRLQQTN